MVSLRLISCSSAFLLFEPEMEKTELGPMHKVQESLTVSPMMQHRSKNELYLDVFMGEEETSVRKRELSEPPFTGSVGVYCKLIEEGFTRHLSLLYET